jgi:hypothetical protein
LEGTFDLSNQVDKGPMSPANTQERVTAHKGRPVIDRRGSEEGLGNDIRKRSVYLHDPVKPLHYKLGPLKRIVEIVPFQTVRGRACSI